jgi:hypothetical protein
MGAGMGAGMGADGGYEGALQCEVPEGCVGFVKGTFVWQQYWIEEVAGCLSANVTLHLDDLKIDKTPRSPRRWRLGVPTTAGHGETGFPVPTTG